MAAFGGEIIQNSLIMPEEEPTERARDDERQGLSPSTQAGEFVREEMEHIREGERRTLAGAGHSHWALESAEGRCKTAATQAWQEANKTPGQA
jgi:hypothetical protein